MLAAGSCLLLGLSSVNSQAEVLYQGSVVAASDYVIRGLSQTNDNPSLQISAGIEHRSTGIYGGLWLANVDTSELIPDLGDKSGIEIDLFVGWSRPLNRDWRWDVNLGHYTYTRDERMLDYDYTELSAHLSYHQLFRASVIYSPKSTDHTRVNTLLEGKRTALEVGGEWPLNQHFSLNAGLGYNDLSEVSDVEHWYWNTGVVYRVSRYAINVSYFGTDSEARDRFIDGRADNRWVVSLMSVFGN